MTEVKPPPPLIVPLLVLAGLVAGFGWLWGGIGGLCVGGGLAGAFLWGKRQGQAEIEVEVQRKQYRVADELIQYRAFTQLMRDQGQRIVDLSEQSVTQLATGLVEIDRRLVGLTARLADPTGADSHPDQIQAELEAMAAPIPGLLAALQFQDVTRQQLMFLSRLSEMFDAHLTELTRLLGDRRSLDRTIRFKEMFDQALDETVMRSQRHDHQVAAGLEPSEPAGPRVELFK